MLLTKKEIFERLKKDGIDLGENPFRTFLYYQETGLIPEPEGKKRNAYLFPEQTVDAVKLINTLQKGGESISQIKKRFKGKTENISDDYVIESGELKIGQDLKMFYAYRKERKKIIEEFNGKLKKLDEDFNKTIGCSFAEGVTNIIDNSY